jgi:hypothetical protein
VTDSFGPDIQVDQKLQGHDSLLSGALAEEKLGFAPVTSWRSYTAGDNS